MAPVFNQIESFGIVAHSAGGNQIVNLAKKCPNEFMQKCFAVAFTDSALPDLKSLPHGLHNWFIKNAKNYVRSPANLNAQLNTGPNEVPRRSAGIDKHEETPWATRHTIFDFLNEKSKEFSPWSKQPGDNTKLPLSPSTALPANKKQKSNDQNRELKIPIVNQLVSNSIEGIHLQRMQCDAEICEYSRNDQAFIDKYGLEDSKAHWWRLKFIHSIQMDEDRNQTRVRVPGTAIHSSCEHSLNDMELIPPIPRVSYKVTHPMAVKFNVNGVQYEWLYKRSKMYARAIDEATMYTYKVNEDASIVQFLVELESVKEVSTPLSMYKL